MELNLNYVWSDIQKGNVKSFELLYQRYYKRLCLYSYSLLPDRRLAEEVVQDFFVNLWQKKNTITIKGSVKSYLFRAVHNESVNAFKKQLSKRNSVNENVSEELWNKLIDILDYNAFILERIEAKETEIKINEAIEALPGQCRKIFKLSRFNDFSNQDISKKLKISVNTVRGQLQKAIQKILQHL